MKMKRAAVTIGFILLSMAGISGCGRERELVKMTEVESNNTKGEIIALPIPESEKSSSSTGDSAENESEATTRLTALE